jgi:hypothetical protein
MPKALKQLAWFAAIWGMSVVAIISLGYAIRLLVQF